MVGWWWGGGRVVLDGVQSHYRVKPNSFLKLAPTKMSSEDQWEVLPLKKANMVIIVVLI